MKRSITGFTIVELLIVIVVIAILAAISVIAYNGIQRRAAVSILQSDLTNAAKQIELANADTGSYPTSLPSTLKISSDIALSLSQASSGFCINGEYKNNSAVRWRYESTNGGLKEGLCNGAVIAGSETGMNPNLVTTPDFSSTWSLNLQTLTGRSLSTRPGTTGDPYPSRPVLQLTNSATTTTTWAVLQSSGLNHSAIQNGKNYTRSYWVRKINNYSGGIVPYGVMTGAGTNQSLWYGGTTIIPSDSWQYVSGSTTAISNSDSSKVLYLTIPTSAFTTSGWTLEFQGFELREQ